MVLHRQAAARKGDRAAARHPGRGALASLLSQSLGAARGHQPREQYLTTKFGSVERYKGIAQRVAAAAAAEGLTYDVDGIARQPNTLDCHRLILWAGNTGDPARMKQRLMELYFTEGADLSDPEVLVRAAAECGMDGETVRKLLASDADVDRVTQEAEQAKEAGIDGVPCFIFGGKFAVSGAQAPEYLAEAIARAATERGAAAAE